jgi:hypothetical protein
MHTGLVQRLQRQSAALGDPQNVVRLADWLSSAFADLAPVGKTRTLIRNLTRIGNLRVVQDGVYEIGVGDGQAVGSPEDKAPPGTLAAFLSAHKEFKTRRGVPSRYAWWLLSPEAKRVLQDEREAGKFGGETGVGAGRSPYMWVQDGSTGGGRAGAQKAAIRPQDFIEPALEALEAHVTDVVREVMG